MARVALDGVPAVDLAPRWGVPQCGVFRQLGSTLDAVHDLGAQGAAAGTTVIAEEQTAGRARGLRPDGALLVDLGAATIAVREGHVELA